MHVIRNCPWLTYLEPILLHIGVKVAILRPKSFSFILFHMSYLQSHLVVILSSQSLSSWWSFQPLVVILFTGSPLSFVTQLFPTPSSSKSVTVLSSITKQLYSLFYHQVAVLSHLSPSGCPLSSVTKWLSSLFYHQMVVLSSITKWLSSLIYHQLVVLSSITKWLSSLIFHQVVVLSLLSPSGCPLSSITKCTPSSIAMQLSSLLNLSMVVTMYIP